MSAARFVYNNRAQIRGLYNQVRSDINRWRSRSRQSVRRVNRTPKRVFSGVGVTSNYDARGVYRRRRMPRRKRRRWGRFIKKVRAVNEKDMGTRTVVMNDSVTVTNAQSGWHCCATLALYPQSSTKNWLNDLNVISQLENLANPTAAAGETIDKTSKIMFKSGILDLTFRNTTYKTDDVTVGAPVEVDVYELMMGKDALTGATGHASLSQVFADGTTDTLNIGGVGTEVTIQSRGATPFDIPAALSRYRIKIFKKKKYFLDPGGTFTYQIRDPKNHFRDLEDLNERLGFNRPGWTRILYIILKVVPGFTVGNNPPASTYQEQMTIGVTRKYSYKIEGIHSDRDRYLTASSTPGNPT